MGTWGASITGNDTALDLQEDYKVAFAYFDVDTAVAKLDEYARKEFGEDDETEWCNYFYSLADFMWKKGILTDAIRDKAVQMVESDFGMADWEDAGKSAVKERRKELDKFIKRITSPQCAPKKIKLDIHSEEIFEDGEIIAIQLKTDDRRFTPRNHYSIKISDEEFKSYNGKYIVFQKLYSEKILKSAIVPDLFDRTPYFRMFKGIYDSVDDIQIDKLEECKLYSDRNRCTLADTLFYFKKRKYRIIGKTEVPEIDKHSQVTFFFLGENWEHSNVDSTFLKFLVERELEITECTQECDVSVIRGIIDMELGREIGHGNGLLHEEYKAFREKEKQMKQERYSEADEMISNGARVFELRKGELLGVAVKPEKNPALLYMVSEDERHRAMLLSYLQQI